MSLVHSEAEENKIYNKTSASLSATFASLTIQALDMFFRSAHKSSDDTDALHKFVHIFFFLVPFWYILVYVWRGMAWFCVSHSYSCSYYTYARIWCAC